MTPIPEIGGPNGDLLGMMRLQGEGFPEGGPSGRLMELRIRLKDEKNLEHALRGMREQGWRGVVALGEPRLLAVLKRAGKDAPAPLPVVPNLQGFMREAVEYGLVGAGLRRAMRVGIVGLTGLGLRSVLRAPDILKRDFPTMLRSFVELELGEWGKLEPPVVFLQEQMTDLALAMNNPRILQAFTEAVKQRTGAGAGFATNNFGRLSHSTQQWGILPDAVLTPCDNGGLTSRPKVGQSNTDIQPLGKVWGSRASWCDPLSENERMKASEAGFSGLIREDPWLTTA